MTINDNKKKIGLDAAFFSKLIAKNWGEEHEYT
jgi:hypothetical protein